MSDERANPTPIPRVAVVGTGAMGTLCALLLASRGSSVSLWGRRCDHVEALCDDRENKRYLPGFPLPEAVSPTADGAIALGNVDLVVSAVPCQHMRPVWEHLSANVPPGTPIVSVAKGIEVGTLLRPTGIIADCVAGVPLACLSGPSIAPEIAESKPATVVVAADDPSLARLVQKGFSGNFFRVYTSDDLVGVELAGAAKNVIAIAAGISDGIGAGANAKASLLTRGLAEITRLGLALGAKAETFRGLAGVGDLVTTCISQSSRNRTAGERIGRGEHTDAIIESTTSIIEGIPSTRSVLELAARHHVEMPIVAGVASVLFEGCKPAEAIERLMTRPLKSE